MNFEAWSSKKLHRKKGHLMSRIQVVQLPLVPSNSILLYLFLSLPIFCYLLVYLALSRFHLLFLSLSGSFMRWSFFPSLGLFFYLPLFLALCCSLVLSSALFYSYLISFYCSPQPPWCILVSYFFLFFLNSSCSLNLFFSFLSLFLLA